LLQAAGYRPGTVPFKKRSVEIDFENSGAQPHHLIASPLVGDSTAEEVEKFFKTNKGKRPIGEKGTAATAVLEGGEGQAVTLDLKPGRLGQVLAHPLYRLGDLLIRGG
jgi:hypothetical protein